MDVRTKSEPRLISIAAGYLVAIGWRLTFHVPGRCGAAGAIFLYDRLRDIPASMGLPPVELYRGDFVDRKSVEALEQPLTAREALLDYVLNDRCIWFIAAGNFFLYIARYGVGTWLPTFLQEDRGLSIAAAGWMSAVFEAGGVLGC